LTQDQAANTKNAPARARRGNMWLGAKEDPLESNVSAVGEGANAPVPSTMFDGGVVSSANAVPHAAVTAVVMKGLSLMMTVSCFTRLNAAWVQAVQKSDCGTVPLSRSLMSVENSVAKFDSVTGWPRKVCTSVKNSVRQSVFVWVFSRQTRLWVTGYEP